VAHMAAAYNLAFCLLRSRADAEDAVQDAYLRAYRAYHQLQGGSVKPWLLTIIRNVCYRRLQERRRTGNVVSLDEALDNRTGSIAIEAHLAAPQISPEQAAIQASDTALLAAALDKLPPAFREVIVLREIEELSYQDIADVIGAPIGTVMSRLSRARAELRTLLTRMMERNERNEL
jgi:RNA polymerase sigma-70 factor, ECF subfamily